MRSGNIYSKLNGRTNTDSASDACILVRALAFRFEAFGRPVKTAMIKKFEEGVFSDLRNLKPGEDASLEKPKASTISSVFQAPLACFALWCGD